MSRPDTVRATEPNSMISRGSIASTTAHRIETQYGVCRSIFRAACAELLPLRSPRHRQVGVDAASLPRQRAHRPAASGHAAALPCPAGAAVRGGSRSARRPGHRHRRGTTRARVVECRARAHRRGPWMAIRAHRIKRAQAQEERRRSDGGTRRGPYPASVHGRGIGRCVRYRDRARTRHAAAGVRRRCSRRHVAELPRGVCARRGADGGTGAQPGRVLPLPGDRIFLARPASERQQHRPRQCSGPQGGGGLPRCAGGPAAQLPSTRVSQARRTSDGSA